MPIIPRYIIREILKQFGIVLVAVISFILIMDFFEKSDNIIQAGLTFSRTITYFLLNIPFVVSQVAPLVFLLAVIIVFSLMNKNNEILALRSSGVSVVNFLRPVVLLGLAGAIILFFFSDVIVNISTAKANKIWIKEVKGKSLITSKETNIWIKGHQKITRIKYYNPATMTVYGVAITFFDDNFHMIRKVDSERGLFDEDKWHFFNSVEQQYDESDDTYDIYFHEKMTEHLDFVPDDLRQVVKTPSEMSFKELLGFIRKVEREGYDATTHWVDLYAKPAFAFASVIMSIFGTGIALRQGRRQGIFINTTIGITIAFSYWVFYSFCLSMGYGEMLPPLIAAWVANILFLCLGFFIVMNIEN